MAVTPAHRSGQRGGVRAARRRLEGTVRAPSSHCFRRHTAGSFCVRFCLFLIQALVTGFGPTLTRDALILRASPKLYLQRSNL